MADEPKSGGDGPVKPRIIDLEAEDVTVAPRAEEVSAEAEPKPQSSPPLRRGGALKWIAAALAAGLLVGAWIYRDLLSSYLPTSEMAALQSRIEALEANSRTLNEQILAVSQAADNSTRAAADLEEAVRSAADGASGIQDKIASIESRLASAESAIGATRTSLDGLRAAMAGGSAPGGKSVDSGVLAMLSQRIEALEKDVASLKSAAGGGSSATAALSQALSDLKAKIAAGAAFKDEYERIARMVPAAPGLDTLARHADAGLANAQGLADELHNAISALPVPETGDAQAAEGWSASIWKALDNIVTIRAIGESDWPALAARCVELARAGELAQAIDAMDETEGSKPPVITEWRDRAAARLKLEAAMTEVSEAVLRQISARGGKP